jgi:hypothetical protein
MLLQDADLQKKKVQVMLSNAEEAQEASVPKSNRISTKKEKLKKQQKKFSKFRLETYQPIPTKKKQ